MERQNTQLSKPLIQVYLFFQRDYQEAASPSPARCPVYCIGRHVCIPFNLYRLLDKRSFFKNQAVAHSISVQRDTFALLASLFSWLNWIIKSNINRKQGRCGAMTNLIINCCKKVQQKHLIKKYKHCRVLVS